MPQVKLAAKFTKDQQPYNGLTDDAHVSALIEDPHTRRYALVAYDVRRITEEIEDGTEVPTVNLVQIEPVVGGDADRIKAEMKKLFKGRTGREEDAQPTLFDRDGEGGVPEASAEELMAERAEAQTAQVVAE